MPNPGKYKNSCIKNPAESCLKKIVLLFSVLTVLHYQAYSQEILNRIQHIVLIDIDQTSGLQTGEQVPVNRKAADGSIIKIGMVEIARYQDGKCAAKIINEHSGFKISVGDSIQLQPPSAEQKNKLITRGIDDLSESVPAFYTVQKIYDDYLLINAGPDSRLKPGQIYPVKRKTSWGYEFLGAVEILRFQEEQCAGRLILHSSINQVALNDVVFAEALLDARSKRAYDLPFRSEKKNTLGYGSIGAGLVSAGLGYFLYSGSRDTYEKYGAAQSGSEAARLWNKR